MSGSREWDDFVSQGHQSIYGDIFVIPGGGSHVTGIQQVETREATKQPTIHRIAPHNKKLWSPNGQQC